MIKYSSKQVKIICRGAILCGLGAAMALELAVGVARAADDDARKAVQTAASERIAAELATEQRFDVETETVRSTKALDFDTEYVYDETMEYGETQVITVGVPGEITTTEVNIYKNGVELSSRMVSCQVTAEPVNQVIRMGTAHYESTGTYIWPSDSDSITSYFGNRTVSVGNSNHSGMDIDGHKGDPIYAADGATVKFAGYSGGYGNVVKLLHDDGTVTIYAHCSKLLVSEGERVYQGQKIAEVGATGTATGNHLHFEVVKDGVSLNPLDYVTIGE
jgi:murein DD-endopeptidase MepM/ murein hydrolase activator NlpD